MHLRKPSKLKVGDRVSMGEEIGKVGDTGDATACHLHFEMWSNPGWYEGGHPGRPEAEPQAVGQGERPPVGEVVRTVQMLDAAHAGILSGPRGSRSR